MTDTLRAIDGIDVVDCDQEPVNFNSRETELVFGLADEMGFQDVQLKLADYAYAQAKLAELKGDERLQQNWLTSAENCNLAACD